VLFMHNEGFSTMCGHGVIAVTKIGIERGLFPGRPGRTARATVVLDSPAGEIRARADGYDRRLRA
jgi:proline racemase